MSVQRNIKSVEFIEISADGGSLTSVWPAIWGDVAEVDDILGVEAVDEAVEALSFDAANG